MYFFIIYYFPLLSHEMHEVITPIGTYYYYSSNFITYVMNDIQKLKTLKRFEKGGFIQLGL